MGDWLNKWRVWSPGHFLSAPGPIIGSLLPIATSILRSNYIKEKLNELHVLSVVFIESRSSRVF